MIRKRRTQIRIAPGVPLQHRHQRIAQPGGVLIEGSDISRIAAGERAGAHRAHPLHEEFIEIGLEDCQESQPLQQRRTFIECLVQHPAVEFEPAEISIEPNFRR